MRGCGERSGSLPFGPTPGSFDVATRPPTTGLDNGIAICPTCVTDTAAGRPVAVAAPGATIGIALTVRFGSTVIRPAPASAAPATSHVGDVRRGLPVGRRCPSPTLALTQLSNYLTLKGSFSAVSKPKFTSKYALESSRRDLQNALPCTVLVGSVWVKKYTKNSELNVSFNNR